MGGKVCSGYLEPYWPFQQLPTSVRELVSAGHLVTFITAVTDTAAACLQSFLSEDEINRSSRFSSVEDRALFTVAHGVKRTVLAGVLESAPEALCFRTAPRGKPVCTYTNAPSFSLSHAKGWVALGIASVPETGIDIELPGEQNYREIASRCLSPTELEAYEASGFDNSYFLKRWTQKESLSKAVGEGLYLDFSRLELVTSDIGEMTDINGRRYYSTSERFMDGYISGTLSHPVQDLKKFDLVLKASRT